MRAVRPRKLGLPRDRLLLVVTGALAARNSPSLVETIRGWYPELTVRVLVTENALRFATRSLLEVTSRERVLGPDWDEGHDLPVPHRELAEWADAVLVYPASGNTVARLAAGIGDSLALTTVNDALCPVIIVPGVSPGFGRRKIHHDNIRRLRESDYVVMDTVLGRSASDGSMNPTAPPPCADIMMAIGKAVRQSAENALRSEPEAHLKGVS